jgi:hypothetical protein
MTLARTPETCAYPPHPGLGEAAGMPLMADSASSRLARWLGHAPAERVPAIAVPAVWTAAEIIHAAAGLGHFTPVAVVVSAAATLAAAGAGYGLGERRAQGEHRRLTGAELAAAVAVTGGWFTAAAGLGPLAGPGHLLSLLYAAVTVGGYAWLRTHEAVRAARSRREDAEARAAGERAKRAEWHALAARAGLRGSHLMAIEPNNNGESWVIDTYSARVLASRVNCDELAQRLAGERGVAKSHVEVTPDPDWAYRIHVLFRAGDPWKGGGEDGLIMHPAASGELNPDAPFAALVPAAATAWDPVYFGADPEAGAPLGVPLFSKIGAHRILVVAPSGSGKSVLLNNLRAGIAVRDDCQLLQINLSKAVEDLWAEDLSAATAAPEGRADLRGTSPAVQARAIVDFLLGVIKARPAARKGTGYANHRPTPAEPLLVVFIDEYDEISKRHPELKTDIELIASKCRSEGIALILATQRPQNTWVSTSLKANLTHLVFANMRSSETRNAAGNEAIELPDLGAYGRGNKGIFGVCEHPVYPGMPVSRGRAFFWGEPCPGLLRFYAAQAARRPRYQLEPALAPLAGLWDAITGAAELPGGDRYDLTQTAAGRVTQGTAGLRARLTAVAGILNGTPGPAGGAERPSDAPAPAPGDGQAGPGTAADRDVAAVLLALAARPGGVSRAEAIEATGFQKTKVLEVFGVLRAAGLVDLRPPNGQHARYYATPGAVAPAPVPGAVQAGPYPPLRLVRDDGAGAAG